MAIGEKAISILIPLHQLSTKRHVSLMTTGSCKFQTRAIFPDCIDEMKRMAQMGVWLLSLIFASRGGYENRPCPALEMADAS